MIEHHDTPLQATNLTTRPHPSDFEARKETWQAPFSGFPRSLRFGGLYLSPQGGMRHAATIENQKPRGF